MGIGFALAQLTNVVLSEIPPEGSGVASGANTTVRQVGSALGVAVIGTVLTVQTVSHAVQHIKASALPAALKAQAIAGVHALRRRATRRRRRRARAHAAVVRAAVEQGVLHGTRVALIFAFVVVAIGSLLSLLIPNTRAVRRDRAPPRRRRLRAARAARPRSRAAALDVAAR